jgi:hypothetical protein
MDGAWAEPVLRENSGMVVVMGGCSGCFGKGDVGQLLLQGLRDDLIIVNSIAAVGDMLNLDLSGAGAGAGMLKRRSAGCSGSGLGVVMGRVSICGGEEEVKTPSGDIWVLAVENHG